MKQVARTVMAAALTLSISGVLCAGDEEARGKGVPLDRRAGVFASHATLQYLKGLPADARIHSAVMGDVPKVAATITNSGVIVTRTASVLTVVTTAAETLSLAEKPYVRSIDVGRQVGVPFLMPEDAETAPEVTPSLSKVTLGERGDAITTPDMARARASTPTVPHPPTGKGVVIAVIEEGVPDIRHPDLRREDGSTRFLAVWDQTRDDMETPRRPGGTVWSAAQLDKMLSEKRYAFQFGSFAEHITNSLGVAAGNGRAAGRWRGVAPEADLVSVSSTICPSDVIDAAAFAFAQAEAKAAPCVVNLSYSPGSLLCDGGSVLSVALSELVQEKPGRAVVSSAGNNAEIKRHSRTRLDSTRSTARWWLQGRPQLASRGTQVARFSGPSAGEAQVRLHDTQTGLRSSVLKVRDIVEKGGLAFDLRDNNRRGHFACVYSLPAGDPTISIEVTFDEAGSGSALEVTVAGAAEIETWSELQLGHLPRSGLPASAGSDYVEPDSQNSIESPADGESVLCAGAYYQQRDPVTKGVLADQGSEPGRPAAWSQPGGPLLGTWKPDVLAPVNIPAANPLDSPMTQSDEQALEGRIHTVFSGTSCASPVLAGAVALYLEIHPKSRATEIARALASSARADDETGECPNSRCGYGKLDISGFLAAPSGGVKRSANAPR